MFNEHIRSWGNNFSCSANEYSCSSISLAAEVVRNCTSHGIIPRGAGRSYGDQSLNSGGGLLSLQRSEDSNSYVVTDSGLVTVNGESSIGDLLSAVIPQGWLLPVVPGSGSITIGGALAADAHGKNHFHQSSLASWCKEMNVMIADGSIIHCSTETERDLFWATVGGLGLTGLIISATLQLQKITGSSLKVNTKSFSRFSYLFEGLKMASENNEYAVAWLDLLSERHPGRGIVKSAHLDKNRNLERGRVDTKSINFPLSPSVNFINRPMCSIHNSLKYGSSLITRGTAITPISDFLFPLDRVNNWKNLYGRAGFLQWQFVVPDEEALLLENIIKDIGNTDLLPSLAVLKRCGKESRSYLSFCRPGWTLAIDFPSNAKARDLLVGFDKRIAEVGGRVYLAKDSCLDADLIHKMYPKLDKWKSIRRYFDPKNVWQSDFSRRLNLI